MKKNRSSGMNDSQHIRVLIIEDSEDDVLLIERELKKGGYNPVHERIETASAMKKALHENQWDFILCDYKMPNFNAPAALTLLKEENVDIPVIIVSGTIGEEKAVECMRMGAHDYIMKGNYSRLCPVIARELQESRLRKIQKETESQKKAALEQLRLSEERYRKITKCIPDLIWIMDLSGRFIYANEAVERTHGWTADEYVNLSLQDLVSPQQIASDTAILAEQLVKANEPGFDRNTTLTFESEELRKDGSTFWAEITATFLWSEDGKPNGILGITRDITERKLTHEFLKESEKKYKLLTEKMTDIVWIVDENLRTVYVTPSVQTVLGFTQEERMNQNADQQLTPDSLSFALEVLYKELAIEEHGGGDPNRSATLILEYYHKNGSTIWMETIMSALRNDQGVAIGIHGVSRDITERRQAELARETALEELRKSEELQTRLVNAIPDIIVGTDLEGNILFVNDNTLRIGGYSREELEGQSLLKYIAPEHLEDAANNMSLRMERRVGPREYNLITKDKREIPFEVIGDVLRNEDGTPFGLVNVGRDLTERKQTETILREKEERLCGITANLPGVIFQFYAKDSGEYGISYISEPLDEFAKILQKLDTTNLDTVFPDFLSRIHEGDRERFITSIKTAVENVSRWNFEGRVAIQSGKIIWFQGLSVPTRLEDQIVFDGILLNISERKLAEEISQKSEEKFHKIFMTTPECIVISRLNDSFIIDANKGYEDILGWKREDVIGKNAEEFLKLFWMDPSERDFMVKELKCGREILNRELKFRKNDGSERFGNYSARTITIDEQECIIFILQDITDRKLMEIELKRTLETLMKSVGTTIQVMVAAIEMRDPYTAGHQLRVADIARAIASEMKLAPDRVDGIRMAGTIHDIGKLSIPAEILSKPTKLTKIEYSLIQEHSLSGYEMLKNVESPWPLAEIVYQHHERTNGTGYPRQLKGDEIILEARILAVADVVEAMASHRPYRASLGIVAALEEIEKNKGVFYDQTVVDACLRLFREKNYQIPQI
ncbi:MAG: PAS domain S-box protein [Syntrophaceae bacterium]|nr:PAS domain S-box protein [Syntrophaceae bacterium]